MNKTFSIGESLSFAWRTFKANFWLFLGIVFIFVINQMLFGLGQSFILRSAWINYGITTQQWIIFGLIVFLYTIINTILVMGIIRISLDFCAGEKPGFGRLFSMWSRVHVMIAASFLFFLMTGLGAFLADITDIDWLLLLLIPGLFLGIIFWFYDFALVDKKLGPISALKEGARVSRGARLKIFLFLIVLFLVLFGIVFAMIVPAMLPMMFWLEGSGPVLLIVSLLGIILPYLAVTVIIPLVWISQAHVYCKLRDFSSQESLTPK